jgi:para-nitrobenzyl esterase
MSRRNWKSGGLFALALLGACAGSDTDLDEAPAAQVAERPAPAGPRVQIDDGLLVGGRDGAIEKYLGIPYAKPPVGALRFKRPEKNEPWSGTREATQFGKRCAQLASAVLQNAASEDEDCLFLNVWTPDSKAEKPLPVMVWIHGGGNANGSANEPLPYVGTGLFYSGHKLAEQGVVVVTLNYRLGVFGFFAHPELPDGGGNQGLFDQQRALAWVKENIAKFGGDPAQVTIFGESAGSQDVCLHVASPVSRGHFQGAISQSGGCTTRNTTQPEAQKNAQALADKLGCSGAGALACLQEKPIAALLSPGLTPPAVFGPIVDGVFMPEQPRALFDKKDIAKVPYILGSNTDEGTLFVQAERIPDEATLRTRIAARYGEASVARILELYPPSSFASPLATLARIDGDARLVCTTTDSALRASAAGANVWMYNFDVPTTVNAPLALPLGATHGAELVYVFGTSTLFTPETLPVTQVMQRLWTNFAKTRDPNDGSAPRWPSFSASQDQRLNFATTTTEVTGFRAAQCAFWRERYAAAFPAAP